MKFLIKEYQSGMIIKKFCICNWEVKYIFLEEWCQLVQAVLVISPVVLDSFRLADFATNTDDSISIELRATRLPKGGANHSHFIAREPDGKIPKYPMFFSRVHKSRYRRNDR